MGQQKAPTGRWGPPVLHGDVDQKKTFAPNPASALAHVLTCRFRPSSYFIYGAAASRAARARALW